MINTISNNFNKLWKTLAIGGTILTYEALYDRIQNKSSVTAQKNDINTIKNDILEVKEVVIKTIQDDSLKTKFLNKLEPVQECFKELELQLS